jgi:ATP-binding cassette subfamily C protein
MGFLWSAARWQVVWAVLLSTLLSLTEGVSLAMIFPLIALLGEPGRPGAGSGRHTEAVFHLLAASHLPRSWWLGVLLLALMAVVGLLAQLNGVLATLSLGILLRVRQRLAEELYRAILHADWVFLTKRRSSDLTHLLTDELGRAGQLTSAVVGVLSNGMVGLLMLGVALYLSPLLTLLLVGCFALVIPLERRSSRAIHGSGTAISVRTREVFESSMERLQNLKVVKAYGAQDAELALFSTRHGGALEQLMQNEWRRNLASRRFQIVSLVLLCGVILAGLGPLHLGAGKLLIFLLAFLRATPRLNLVQSKTNEILSDLPAYRSIVGFVAECEAHSEREQAAGERTGREAPTLERELALRGVTFSYGADQPVILDRLNLVFPAGKVTALAGPSGAGKSTIADLVMGLLLPQEGEVTVDSMPITRANARAWRKRVGYVSQDTLLFHASVRENLLWAKPRATAAEIREALERANAGFVHQLARGVDTLVGDRGMMLSHGQRQRIALARAFLLRPALLILDEATNSLDVENEETILQTVRRAAAGVTTLLISHRPSAVRAADLIYVLAGGSVRLSGSWDEVKHAFADTGDGRMEDLGAMPGVESEPG